MHSVERTGQEPAVICVHGYCQSSFYWLPTLDRLAAEGARCLAVDLPGFGASAAEPGPYTMEGVADALPRMLDAQGIAKSGLVGAPMGGVVARHLGLRHPPPVERLLLVAPGAYTPAPAGARAIAEVVEAA